PRGASVPSAIRQRLLTLLRSVTRNFFWSEHMNVLRNPRHSLLVVLAAAALAASGYASGTVSFLAVGAGDASSSDAILWTRAQDPASATGVALVAQVSRDPTFASGVLTFPGASDATADYTFHVDATGLESGSRYYYRFVAAGNTVSPVGTFVTAPAAAAH